jgi:hypothetical protein
LLGVVTAVVTATFVSWLLARVSDDTEATYELTDELTDEMRAHAISYQAIGPPDSRRAVAQVLEGPRLRRPAK